jgi:hypothetical protein
VLFMTGSALFALGSFPLYGQTVDPGVVATTFVVGSLLFTAAAAGQLWQTRRAGVADRRLLWSALIQFAGTLLFNVNTIDATRTSLSTQQTNRVVWAPDMFGSAAFLVASYLAWLVVCHRAWCVRRDDESWWVAAVNLMGSVLFMLAALASFTLRTTGDTVNTTVVNSGTFLGAMCFLLGAYLLLPARQILSPRPPAHGPPVRPIARRR